MTLSHRTTRLKPIRRAWPPWFILPLLLVLQAGCSTGNLVPEPDQGKELGCRIHLYRPDSPSIVGVAEVPYVYLDGRRVARLAKGCVLVLPVAPGPHRVDLRASFMTVLPFYGLGGIELDAGEGEEFYLRFIANVDEAHTMGERPPMTTFLRVPEALGREQTRNLRNCPVRD